MMTGWQWRVTSVGVLLGALLSTTVGVASAGLSQPTDIQGYWAGPAIQQLVQHNILGGYPDGTFRPSGTITRAEFSAILVKALNIPTPPIETSAFSDVPPTFWAASAIQAVRQAGLVGGYPDGTFHPFEPISRAGALAVLANVTPGQITDSTQIQQSLNRFVDGVTVPTWAQAATAEVLQSGVYASDPIFVGQLQPNRPITRGEVAAMTSNLLTRLRGGGAFMGTMASSPQTGLTTTSMSQAVGQPLQGRIVTVPAQTQLTATLTTALNSETAKVGDMVKATLDMPIASSDNLIVVPSGSQVVGEVLTVEPAGRLEKNATVNIRFKEIVTAQGERLPIQGSVATVNGILEGGSMAGRLGTAATKTAIGAGLGAALGTAMGPLSGGSVGKGAIYGTAIGAGVGAVASGVAKGNPVVLQSGEKLQVRLDQPLQTTVSTATPANTPTNINY
ncbi:MAG: S-layer homology domain-containing protein [Vampirovibrionales bacterium]